MLLETPLLCSAVGQLEHTLLEAYALTQLLLMQVQASSLVGCWGPRHPQLCCWLVSASTPVRHTPSEIYSGEQKVNIKYQIVNCMTMPL